MRATVVVDNIPNHEMTGEWGLCIFIEYQDKKILLDTGASALFARNADKQNIPLDEIDFAVLSHAHYDHANGMESFFQLNPTAKFYLQRSCAENCYHKKWIFHKYIGIPRGILKKYTSRIVPVYGCCDLYDGVRLISHSSPGLDAIGKRENMFQRKNGRWYPDDFSHEQSLVFETPDGIVIFNSCCHGGAANIIQEVRAVYPDKKILALVGGLHIYNKTEHEVRTLAGMLRDLNIERVYTGHCTGKTACGILKEELGDVVQPFYTGFTMDF